MTRFQISLTPEEMNHLYFQMSADSHSGTVSVYVSERRFVELLAKALDWRDHQKMLEEAKKP